MVDPFLTFESLSAGMMRWIIVLLLWCFLLRLYSLIFHHFNAKNIPPLCFPTSFISSFNVSFISILISLLFNLTTEIFVNSVGSSVTFRRRSEWVQLIDLFLDSDSFIIKYHLSSVDVQTNYCNNNLLTLDAKQLNKIMKLNYFLCFKSTVGWPG